MDTVGLEAAARIGEGVTTVDPERVAGAGANAWREAGMYAVSVAGQWHGRTALDLDVDPLGSRGPNAEMRAIWSNCRSEWWYWGSARHLPSVPDQECDREMCERISDADRILRCDLCAGKRSR